MIVHHYIQSRKVVTTCKHLQKEKKLQDKHLAEAAGNVRQCFADLMLLCVLEMKHDNLSEKIWEPQPLLAYYAVDSEYDFTRFSRKRSSF